MILGSAKWGRRISNSVIYVALSILGALWVLPIVYLVYTAFREAPSTGIINTLFPKGLRLGLGNFGRLFSDTMFSKWLMAIRSTLLTLSLHNP